MTVQCPLGFPACSHRPVYIDADEYGEQGKQTTALQVRCEDRQAAGTQAEAHMPVSWIAFVARCASQASRGGTEPAFC